MPFRARRLAGFVHFARRADCTYPCRSVCCGNPAGYDATVNLDVPAPAQAVWESLNAVRNGTNQGANTLRAV